MRGEGTRLALLSMHTDPLAPLGGDFTGGMNVYAREVARALAALGVRADVFTRLESPALEAQAPLAPGARLARIEAGPARRLDKDAQRGLVDEFAGGVLAFAEESRIRYDGVSAHYWLSGLAGERLAGRWGVPLALRFHTLAKLKNDALPPGSRRESAERLAAEPALARAADALFASSPAEARTLEEMGGAADARVVPCGVDLEKFRPRPKREARARLGLAPDAALVLGVGRIERVKGLDRLIEALGLLARERPGLEARLLHVGGELKKGAKRNGGGRRAEDFASAAQAAEVSRLEALATERGVGGRVSFLGAKPQEALSLFYAAADVFALPSRYESFGMTAMEAAACGLPTLAFDVGGLSRAVAEGESGHLVPDGDVAAYARKMLNMLENRRARPLRRARAWAESFAWTRVAEAELEVWTSLRSGRARGRAAEPALASPHAP